MFHHNPFLCRPPCTTVGYTTQYTTPSAMSRYLFIATVIRIVITAAIRIFTAIAISIRNYMLDARVHQPQVDRPMVS